MFSAWGFNSLDNDSSTHRIHGFVAQNLRLCLGWHNTFEQRVNGLPWSQWYCGSLRRGKRHPVASSEHTSHIEHLERTHKYLHLSEKELKICGYWSCLKDVTICLMIKSVARDTYIGYAKEAKLHHACNENQLCQMMHLAPSSSLLVSFVFESVLRGSVLEGESQQCSGVHVLRYKTMLIPLLR